MLDIRLEIGQINYQKCIEALLPPLVEHCQAKAQPNTLDKYLAELGAEAVPAARGVLEHMDAGAKDKMLVWLVAAHEERMRNAANRHLAELMGEPLIRIGRLLALDRPDTRMTLLASQVSIDYSALLRSELVSESVERLGAENSILKGTAKLALHMGAHMSSRSLEKQCVTLLNTKRVKGQLMSALTNALRQAGLDIEIEDMAAEANPAIQLPESLDSYREPVPEGFAEELMAALNGELRKIRGEKGT